MWRRDKQHGADILSRRCPHCSGSGKQFFDPKRDRCACPWSDHCEDVEHPLNTPNEDKRLGGIGKKLVLCGKCRSFWVIYFECGDDSWDVPGPECLGTNLPPDDWGKPKADGAT